MRSWKAFVFLLLIPLLLTACGKVGLHHGLSEAEADKILVLLDKNSIEAEKEKSLDGQDVSWTVMVKPDDVPVARRLLVENNLPARPELGLSGVYQEKGLIPTPDEQRARFLLALKGELVNALRTIPGVYEVGVVLNVPEEKDLQFGEGETPRPSASVVLRIGDPSLLQNDLTEEKVRRFVANAIPEMAPNDVIVIMSTVGKPVAPTDAAAPAEFPAPPRQVLAPETVIAQGEGIEVSPGVEVDEEQPEAPGFADENSFIEIAGIQLDAGSVGKFRIYLIIFLCVLILLSAALLLTLFRYMRMRKKAKPQRLQAVPGGPRDLLHGAPQKMARGPRETGT